MTEKTKSTFNLSNKEFYKYRKVYKGRVSDVNHLETLNSIQLNSESLNGKIDEYYPKKIILGPGIFIMEYCFTIND